MESYARNTSSSTSGLKYDVFLSFRGAETRKKFTGHLYTALDSEGVRTFIDFEEIQTGQVISQALIVAIKQSRISIPILSKCYADSGWCLEELAMMLQCSQTHNQIVLPIFFDVVREEVQNQTGSFGEAFRTLDKLFKPELLERWKEALRNVAKLKALNLKDIENGDESTLSQLVVNNVLSVLNTTLSVDTKYPIGLNSRVSSSSSRSYDVFLNSSDGDPRKKFTGHLHKALESKGFHTFIDNQKHHAEKEIGPALLMAIKQSKISIPIFSKCYASSTWCLQELAMILECNKRNDQIVLPIYFNIEPSEVRNQTGSFEEAFRRHEKDFKLEIVAKWKRALREIGQLKGWDLKEVASGNESKLVDLAVKRAWRELHYTPLVAAKHPIGLKSRVKSIIALLNLESKYPKFVGICGMGGIGKTTMAKAVYNEIFKQFDGSSFLVDVREQASQKVGLVRLQEQLLNDILGKHNYDFRDIERGSKLIEESLQEKKVLVILDDVDSHRQLNALAGELSWFGPRSRIIITTRDEQVLKVGQVDKNNIYKPDGLNGKESLQLFSLHAFRKAQPPDDFLQLSRNVVSYIRGLPLTLEVLGSFLWDVEGKEKWESALQKLKKVSPDEVHYKLKISYDGLHLNEKAIFLDIACFFIGKNKKIPVYMWEGCGFYPDIGLEVLIRKSLIRIDDKGELGMHDQLRDMGRRIVQEESINELGKRSRLWSCEEAVEVLKEKKGTEQVEGIFLDFMWEDFFPNSEMEASDHVRIEDLATMSNLRVLLVNGVNLRGDNIGHLPSKLRWLYWQRCPLKIIPSNFCIEKLVVLELPGSDIREAWNDGLQNKRFENLKILDLSNCRYLAKSPNFSRFPLLEKLILKGCKSLVEVHESIEQLKKLVHLDLNRCSKLMTLPKSIGDLKSLVELELDATAIHELPNSVEMLSKMRCLSLRKCCSLTIIPNSIGRIKSLVELNLDGIMIKEIPDSVGLLKKLEKVCVNRCRYLKSIPNLPSSLVYLDASGCVSLQRLPNLSNLKSLQILRLRHCSKLATIQGLDGTQSLEDLDVVGCINLMDTLTEVLVQDSFNTQPFSFCDIQKSYEVGDDMINKGMLLCLISESDEEVRVKEDEEGKLLSRTLTIETHIHRRGKRITCKSSLDIQNIEMTFQKIRCIHHFQGHNWFGFPLEVKDEIEIAEIEWYGCFPQPKLKYLKLSTKDQKHIPQPISQQLSAKKVNDSIMPNVDVGELHPRLPTSQQLSTAVENSIFSLSYDNVQESSPLLPVSQELGNKVVDDIPSLPYVDVGDSHPNLPVSQQLTTTDVEDIISLSYVDVEESDPVLSVRQELSNEVVGDISSFPNVDVGESHHLSPIVQQLSDNVVNVASSLPYIDVGESHPILPVSQQLSTEMLDDIFALSYVDVETNVDAVNSGPTGC